MSVAAVNIGLFKSNQPAKGDDKNAFRKYQDEQNLSAEERIEAYKKKQLEDRRRGKFKTKYL